VRKQHKESHRIANIGWLRAAVLGANDGIISTASLIMGVAAAQASHQQLLLTGLAGLAAGSMSMATGEFISVSSQADTEKAALEEEKAELEADFDAEHRELTGIYMSRGLDRALAGQVATGLMAHDALGAHARDELGISEISTARPLQAVTASAASFASGAALPLAVTAIAPAAHVMSAVGGATLISLACLGALAAKAGRADMWNGAIRITFWGILAMAVTSVIGRLFGAGG
jgi:VIT1/CCC1 family predicted Fe2+/Mn2+ transporter